MNQTSYGEWQDSPTMKEPPLKVTGEVYNYNEREYDDDYYSQPGDLFRLMPAEEQQFNCSKIQLVLWETLNYLSNNVMYATATKLIPHTEQELPRHWELICKRL